MIKSKTYIRKKMNEAALIKKSKIEKLYDRANKFELKNIKEKFIGSSKQFETPFEKLYILKKLYSILYCLSENKMLSEEISDEFFALLKKSSKVYFYFILEVMSDFHKINRNELLIVLGTHFARLAHKLMSDK